MRGDLFPKFLRSRKLRVEEFRMDGLEFGVYSRV